MSGGCKRRPLSVKHHLKIEAAVLFLNLLYAIVSLIKLYIVIIFFTFYVGEGHC